MENEKKFYELFRSIASFKLSSLSCPDEYLHLFKNEPTLYLMFKSKMGDDVQGFFNTLNDTLVILNGGSEALALETSKGWAALYGCSGLSVSKGVDVKPTVDKYLNGKVEGSKGEKIHGIDFSGDDEDEESFENSSDEVDDSVESVSEPSNEEDEDTSSSDELSDEVLQRAKNLWSTMVSPVVDTIVDAYKALYASGYGIGSRTGILTNEGVITCSMNGDRIPVGTDSEALMDMDIYDTLVSVLGDKYTRYAGVGEEPDYNTIKSGGSRVYSDMHLKFMFGYFSFCKGRKNGLRAYLTKHNIHNDNSNRVVKYEHMEGWIRESIERYLYKALNDIGAVPTTSDRSQLRVIKDTHAGSVKGVLNVMANSLQNVLVVTQRQVSKSKGTIINEVIRVSSSEQINLDSVTNSLIGALNLGGGSNIKVETKQLTSVVIEVNVIFNEKAYTQDLLFAHMLLDDFREQGIRPSWNNVVLGKTLDENLFTQGWEADTDSLIAIYGAKGSGKGVMTMNILASALVDGCVVTYTDAKPDTATVLANVAWRRGVDLCAFNGIESGIPFEYGCSLRPDKFDCLKYIPEGMFGGDEEKIRQLVITTNYYRSLEMFLDCIIDRMSIAQMSPGGNLPKDREKYPRIVAVFDELQQLGGQEVDVLLNLDMEKKARSKAMTTVVDEKGVAKQKKVNVLEDPIYQFIEKYEKWRSGLSSKLSKAAGSALRKGNCTMICIWQTAEYPRQYKSQSLLAEFMSKSKSDLIKIIGKGAIVQGAEGSFGNMTTKSESWYDTEKFDNIGGYWAYGRSLQKMTVFKPFNVYSSADESGKAMMLRNIASKGMSEEDLIGCYLNPDGSVIPEVGFEGYADKLLGMFGMDTATQLNKGFVYFNNFVVSSGLASSIYDYVYNFKETCGQNIDDKSLKGISGIKYTKDDGSSEEDMSDPEKTYDKVDETLKRVMDNPIDEPDYLPNIKGEPSDEEDDISLWDEEEVFDNYDSSDKSGIPTDIQDYIHDLEHQLEMAMLALQRTNGSGIPYDAGTYDGTNEPIPDYVRNPIKDVASIDLGKEIGSMNFDADEISCTGDLMTKVTEAVYAVFGDFSRYNNLRVIGGNLYINDTRFSCKLDVRYAQNIPYDIRIKANSGHVADLFNYNSIYAMSNLQAIEVDSDSFFGGYIAPQLGCDYDGGCIKALFNSLKNLKVVKIGKKLYTSENYASQLGETGRNYNRLESISWGSNAFFAKTFKKSRDLASACLSLSKNPATGSNCQKFLANHGILRAGAKVLGTTAGAVGMAATGVGYMASGAVGLGSKVVNGVQNIKKQSSVKKQAKSFAEGLKDLWNN